MNLPRAQIDSWNHLQAIVDDPLPDKLRRCLNVADVHCALTGDDSLTHPLLKLDRQEQIDGIGKELKSAKAVAFKQKHGIEDLL